MVAHLWANQSQANARNGTGSMSFDGPVVFSYSTPIAMLHETRAGRVALITSEKYSVTTSSRHMPEVSRAIHSATRYHVPYVGAFGGQAPSRAYKPDEWHAVNVAHLVEEYRELGARIRRATWTYYTSREQVQSVLDDAANIARRYCEAFKLKAPEFDTADDARVIWRAREIRDERRNDPKQVAKRERAKELKEARDAAREAKERAERFAREAEYRADFRAGRFRTGYHRVSDEHGGAMLRVDADKVATSWGAECPLEDARRAWPLIMRARDRGQAWRPEGLQGVQLGSFALTEVRADGSIRAGCHVINWSEIEGAARALGLL